jgi:O-succinylbenzoate synthase
MARAALADAMFDVSHRRRGASLASSLGAAAGSGLAWTAVLGLPVAGADESVRLAQRAIGAGASALKLKIAPPWGPSTVPVLLDACAATPLAVDGNGSFAGQQDLLVDLAARLADQPRESVESGESGARSDPTDLPPAPRCYVEQPLPPDDLVGHAELAPRLAVPIALDESIESAGDVAAAWHLGACGLVNVKPARVGGVAAAVELLGVGRTSYRVLFGTSRADMRPAPGPAGLAVGLPGPSAFLGGMFETGIGRATALAVGAALGLSATDLGPSSWYFDDDITAPIELGADGLMRPPTGPGIGVEPRTDRLAALAVDRLLVRL